MTKNQLNKKAFNFLTETIFFYEELIKNNTNKELDKEYKTTIEVCEYLIKAIGGEVRKDNQ